MNRGKSFITIIARIYAAANSGNTKYFNHFSDKTNWDRADWTAFCLLTLVNVNTRNVNRIFYKKAWTQEHKEKTSDLSEPYWQFHLIELCLRFIKKKLAEELAPDTSDTDNTKLPHKDNMQDEADETSIIPFKVFIATAGFYSIYYLTGQEINTLTLAHYTADTIQKAYKDTPDGRVTLSQITAASIEIAREQQTWLNNLEL
ncbi:putative DNA repair helicase rad5 [Aspergillus affinis]|uniref:putative DNA repair helicase rad5 n=1 Tax=Aspergillus affinis TaxID=1070780 RepID=UPI0022FE00F6|nr:putative DNA repair helicase rad5 [Aspergillus affinis]KAI9035394.1 putative DNA repair helicase rad5 [Aspergillus affinis]